MGLMTQDFNEKLDDRNKKFTFFVPRDKAWHALSRMLPSLHKKLFMADFKYHSQMILERHLVIADKAYTMADMMNQGANETFVVMPAYRGEVKIKVREEERSKYLIAGLGYGYGYTSSLHNKQSLSKNHGIT